MAKQFYINLISQQVSVRVSEVISCKGLFSLSVLRENALIIYFKGELISRAEMEACEQIYFPRRWADEYMLEVRDYSAVIYLTVYGNRTRFDNHNCEPNACFYTLHRSHSLFRVVFVYSITDIVPGEDIKVDYGWDAEEGTFPLVCACATPTGRTCICF